jgi:hypothetical protein
MRSYGGDIESKSVSAGRLARDGTDTVAAERAAERLYQTNSAALARSQPSLEQTLEQWRASHESQVAEWTWVFGRDGSLTARDGEGRWWGGTSLPLRVGQTLMHSLEQRGPVGCYLAPGTAGEIGAALEKIGPEQAIIAVIPDELAAVVALHCGDLAESISSGRLWLACGESWAAQLAELLRANEGLCVPQQYIRTGLIEEGQLSALLETANGVLSEETARRGRVLAGLREKRVRSGRVCVAGGSRFSLWDFAGLALSRTLCGGERFVHLDGSRPTSASPMALAAVAVQCDALVMADVYRADLPGVVPDDVKWITWATEPRFAAPSAEGDGLLVADERWRKPAIAAGWAADRVRIAGWPMLGRAEPAPKGGALALIADAVIAPPPDRVKEYSSQAVLWEQIAAELESDPLVLGENIDAYLHSRMSRLDIEMEASLDQTLFRNKLILPAWRRGVARLLIGAGLPLKLFGAGWEADERWGGAVTSLEELMRALAGVAALVYPSPAIHAHAVSSLGRAVIYPQRAAVMIHQANAALRGEFAAPAAPRAVLCEQAVLGLL